MNRLSPHRPPCLLVRLTLPLLFLFPLLVIARTDTTVRHILWEHENGSPAPEWNQLTGILPFGTETPFNQMQVRLAIERLVATGSFHNVVVLKRPGAKGLDLIFRCTPRPILKTLSISGLGSRATKQIRESQTHLVVGEIFTQERLERALIRMRALLGDLGYPKAKISPKKSIRQGQVFLTLSIIPGQRYRLGKIGISSTRPDLSSRLATQLRHPIHIPARVEGILNSFRQELVQKGFHFPSIQTHPVIKDDHVDLEIRIDPGFCYRFTTMGWTPPRDLIQGIWTREVQESWALSETNDRIAAWLRERGYLTARVRTRIETKDKIKNVRIAVARGSRSPLTQVLFQGNRHVTAATLHQLISIDDLFFDHMFWLRPLKVQTDLEILKWYYYYQGFPSAHLSADFDTKPEGVRLIFHIREGRRYMVESVLVEGNLSVPTPKINDILKISPKDPFAQQRINQAVIRLQDTYRSMGFRDVNCQVRTTEGTNKSLFFTIHEGLRYRFGHLSIMGGSRAQQRMVKRRFPVREGDWYDAQAVARFQDAMDRTSLFTRWDLRELPMTESRRMDVNIALEPDTSQFHGLGLGYEERRGFRGTVEYQRRNILGSTSTLSGGVQLGLNEQRGLLILSRPLGHELRWRSSLKAWKEYEIYSSYRFDRWGLSETILREWGGQEQAPLLLSGTLSHTSTDFSELKIPQDGLDLLDKPFQTLSLSLSLSRDLRDDPFNATRGLFWSAHVKWGLPLEEERFLKTILSVQVLFPLGRRSHLSLSGRSGWIWGEPSIAERFFAGGSHTFRGVRSDRLGPVVPAALPSDPDQALGGQSLYLMNLEASFPLPILSDENVYWAIFSDIGQVFERPGFLDISAIQWCGGIGLRYKTPLGPLRIDFAWNINRNPEHPFLVQIGIGNVF